MTLLICKRGICELLHNLNYKVEIKKKPNTKSRILLANRLFSHVFSSSKYSTKLKEGSLGRITLMIVIMTTFRLSVKPNLEYLVSVTIN